MTESQTVDSAREPEGRGLLGRFSTFELILLALFSALVVAAKMVLRFPIQISGHSSAYWMAILVVALGIVPKLGAGSIIGLVSGLLAGLLGLGDHGVIYTFFSYLALGVASDVTAAFLGSGEKFAPAVLIGAAGSVGRLLAKTAMATIMGIPAGFAALGLGLAFVSNVSWGIIGGLLGYAVLRALRSAGFFAYLSEKR